MLHLFAPVEYKSVAASKSEPNNSQHCTFPSIYLLQVSNVCTWSGPGHWWIMDGLITNDKSIFIPHKRSKNII